MNDKSVAVEESVTASDSRVWRDLAYFVAGPSFVAIAVSIAFKLDPWPVPVPSQAQILNPTIVLVTLFIGAVGVSMSSLIGLPSTPSFRNGRRWSALLVASSLPGAAFGVALFGIDSISGLTAGAVRALGATWVNVPLPASIPHYAAATVLIECFYRLIPIPIFGWLVGRIVLRGRAPTQVFWTLAVLTSLLEPASQLGLAQSRFNAALAGLIVLTFAANLFEAHHFKRYGWPAPVIFRLAFYAVWHCFGPYLMSPQSVLYPGPH